MPQSSSIENSEVTAFAGASTLRHFLLSVSTLETNPMPESIPDIEPDSGQDFGGSLSAAQQVELSSKLDAVYDQVPTTCCAGSGECCVLTDEEMQEGYATMFPLYLAEYVRIAEYVRTQESPERAQRLLAHTQERPHQCPFLGEHRGCMIYSVRPLICRTYAVLDQDTIAAAAEQHADEMPEEWIKGFVRRESATRCPRVTVTQPDKLVRHIHNLISYTYERTMVRLSRTVFEQVSKDRRQAVRSQIRRRGWPTRWTWGGYNTLYLTSASWIQGHLKRYWKRAQLNDLD